VLVERGDALASDKLAGGRVVLGGDQGGERLQVDLLVEVGELAPEEVDDAVGTDCMDAGEQDEGTIAVRTVQPGEVADVGGALPARHGRSGRRDRPGAEPADRGRMSAAMARRWHAGPRAHPCRCDRPGSVPGLSCWFGVEPPAGIEPATPSLPWNHREPLCGPPFPQVAPDRTCRGYRFSFGEVMRSPSRHVWSSSPCPEGRVEQAQAEGEAEPGGVGLVAGHRNDGRLSPGDDSRHRRDPRRLVNGSPTCPMCWPADRAAPSVPSDGLDRCAQGEARPIASASRPEPTRSRKSRAP
jgi:hypothetical protein